MRILVVTAPASIVSLDEAKLHLRVRQDDEDSLITSCIAAASKHLDGPDGWLGRAIMPQVIELQQALTDDPIRLPLPPLIALESIKYLDADGVEQVAAEADFYLYGSEGNILKAIATKPPWSGGSSREDALRIRFKAGYAADPEADPLVAAPPETIKEAVLRMVADLYSYRETVAFGNVMPIPMAMTVERMLFPYRIWS